MVNFTHEWEREIREWDICDPDKRVKFGAYYFMNYDCEFNTLKCTTNGREESLSDIFADPCFDQIRIVKIRYPPKRTRRASEQSDTNTTETTISQELYNSQGDHII